MLDCVHCGVLKENNQPYGVCSKAVVCLRPGRLDDEFVSSLFLQVYKAMKMSFTGGEKITSFIISEH